MLTSSSVPCPIRHSYAPYVTFLFLRHALAFSVTLHHSLVFSISLHHYLVFSISLFTLLSSPSPHPLITLSLLGQCPSVTLLFPSTLTCPLRHSHVPYVTFLFPPSCSCFLRHALASSVMLLLPPSSSCSHCCLLHHAIVLLPHCP